MDATNPPPSQPAIISQGDGNRVAILLCTRRGARFLPFQLASILNQSHRNWCLFASDDGSDDDTVAVLKRFQSRFGHRVSNIRTGPQRGFVANFLSLSCAPDIEGSYFAFCDQDDVWEPDKLEHALKWFSQIDPRIPALYCSRTRLIDGRGNSIGLSPLYARAPHFRNAIVQSIAGGNTMVFNAAARRLLVKAGPDVAVASHDWWLYMLVTAAGGRVRYDHRPSVAYRVHGANAIGANRSLQAQLVRAGLLLKGRLKTWTDMHVAALATMLPEMSQEAKSVLADFEHARRQSALWRMCHFSWARIYRQTLSGNIALYIALVLRKA